MASSEWFEKDYYKVLGVSKDATPDQIKKAFRKIARDNHPDKFPDDKSKEARFKEASEANAILSDPKKREEYDQIRAAGPFMGGFGGAGHRGNGFPGGFQAGNFSGFPGGGNFQVHFGDGDFSDLGGLGDLLGGLGGFSGPNRGGTRRHGPQAGADIEGNAEIDFTQSLEGTTVSLNISSDKPCAACNGSGMIDGKTCHICQGSGQLPGVRKVSARIPAGVATGQRIRLRGQGGAGKNGGPAGDLYLTVAVKPHKLYERDGKNLRMNLPVTFTEAVFGTEVEVPKPLGGSVKLRIPENTANGQTLRVRGAGVPSKTGAGDLLVKIQVQVPRKLSEEAREALAKYAQVAQEPNPREGMNNG